MKRKPYRAIAEWYDAENERHAMLKQDVPFFLGQLPLKKQSILELACGTARAAIPMAQAGHRVVGIDYAPEMIEIAIAKRDAAGLKERQLRLEVGDMLDLNIAERFDWVCIYFNTFLSLTTLEEQDRALHQIASRLKPNGRLWLDIFNPDPSLLAQPIRTGLSPYIFRSPADGQTIYFSTDIRRGKSVQLRHVTFRYSWFDAKGRRRRAEHSFDMTFMFPRELQLLLERNGLEIEQMWGNYDGSEITPESPRMIVRCCRI